MRCDGKRASMDHRESVDVLKGLIDEYTAAWNTADLAAFPRFLSGRHR
jgi:hypothetical protein